MERGGKPATFLVRGDGVCVVGEKGPGAAAACAPILMVVLVTVWSLDTPPGDLSPPHTEPQSKLAFPLFTRRIGLMLGCHFCLFVKLTPHLCLHRVGPLESWSPLWTRRVGYYHLLEVACALARGGVHIKSPLRKILTAYPAYLWCVM